MSADLEHIRQIMREADCLYTEAEVEAAIARVGAQINEQLADANPVVFCVMNGGLIFSGKLLTYLDFPLEASYLHATRYRSSTQGGGLVWKRQPDAKRIEGRDVLVIDDILDEGHTLVAIRQALLGFAPASLKVAVLTEKLHNRRAPHARAEFIGLQVGDRYVFGCGMDYKEYWRQLPAIYAVKGL